MKKRRFSNIRYTFLVLPENGGPSMRFRASTLLLAAIPLLMIALAGAASTLYLLHERSSWKVDQLNRQMAVSTGAYENEIANKDWAIKALQTKVVQFAQQAQSVQSQLDELDKMASTMRSMVGIEDKQDAGDDGGVGGEQFDATDNDIRQLTDGMEELYGTLGTEIGQLKDKLTRTKKVVKKKQQELRVTPTFWPTSSQRITSVFGVRIDPFTSTPSKHTGIDIGGHSGDAVFAAADGTVVDTGYNDVRGNYILIRHKQGISTKYMHLSAISVSPGDSVKQGQQIGQMGSTGRSTGPHLHFEVLENGTPVDPKPYLKMAMRGIASDVQILEKGQD